MLYECSNVGFKYTGTERELDKMITQWLLWNTAAGVKTHSLPLK